MLVLAKESTLSVVVKEPRVFFVFSDTCLGAHPVLGSANSIFFLIQGCRGVFILQEPLFFFPPSSSAEAWLEHAVNGPCCKIKM